MFKALSTFILSILCVALVAQVTVTETAVDVSVTQAVLLGTSDEVRNLVPSGSNFKAKKKGFKKNKKVPDNFKGRRGQSKAIIPELEHLGPDPLRQLNNSHSANGGGTIIEPLVNIQGIGDFGSPHDPTGDVGLNYYIQAINVTDVGVYDKDGNLVQEFAMSDLWAPLGASSAGDPIVLFDEANERWFITEFTDPANLLVAVSVTSDPLGSYYAYSFSTPNFPDYPKYAVWPDALVVTTNEEGGGTLHQYFIDKAGLLAGNTNVTIQRVAIPGSTNTEAGFYVSTPIDIDGDVLPTDTRPMVTKLNDSSWGAVPQDAIDLVRFNIDWANPNNTTTETISIPVTNYDSYPCSAGGFGFACVPQLDGNGLDAIPEVIMNVPKYRNFGSHESIVLSFVTDVTNGNNLSGIRWVELRKTPGNEWGLYQEGTYSPDGLDRYMSSIAIDKNGNIGLGYNVSSENEYVGVRYTGRFASDPLGEMTVAEYNVVNGSNGINSGGRFGDYSQMSVDPVNGTTFWFTTEYAGGNSGSITRIVAFELGRDTNDLAVTSIIQPQTSTTLGANEAVEIEIKNVGIDPMSNFDVGFLLNGTLVDQANISTTLQADETTTYTFGNTIDLSAYEDYTIQAYVNHPDDTNVNNDTLTAIVSRLYGLDASLSLNAVSSTCNSTEIVTATITNLGFDVITSADIIVSVDGNVVETINWTGSIASGASVEEAITINSLNGGANNISIEFANLNNGTDENPSNNTANVVIILDNNSVEFTLNLLTDNYPTETTWEVTDEDGNVVASGGPYSDEATLEVETFCVSNDACYTFTIYDSYGDGICCGPWTGNGNYNMEDQDGTIIFSSNGEFEDSESQIFCADGTGCSLTSTFTIVDDSDNGNGSILVMASGGTEPYMYSIDGGATFQSEPLFENLTGGDYDVLIQDDEDCTYSETVTVMTTTSLNDLAYNDYSFIIRPNPSDGYFNIELSIEGYNNPSLYFEIIDAKGAIVHSRRMGSYDGVFLAPVSLIKYPAGAYFVKVRGEEFHAVRKVLIH